MSAVIDITSLREWLDSCGQSHVLEHWDSLTEREQVSFEGQLKELRQQVDVAHLNRVFKVSVEAVQKANAVNATTTAADADIVEPPSPERFFHVTPDALRDEAQKQQVGRIRKLGLDVITGGRLAVLVLAGGSGTRLGQTFPKGMLVCPDLVVPKSLFELQAERIRRMEHITKGAKIPLVLMTSPQTDDDTREYFKRHDYFGLSADQVHFFVQSAIPCFDRQGRILLETKSRVATAPGGNGGIYQGFAQSGLLSKLESDGVEFVQVVTVDNILGQLADPVLTGYAVQEEADVVVKATPKASDQEAVGVFAVRQPGNRWGVVEYTEIGPARAAARDNVTGERLFNASNIAVHLMSMAFMKRAAEAMRTYEWYHAAFKKIPAVDGPVDGVKLEAFIFDLFEFSQQFRILQVDRAREFSPVKNADDEGKTKRDTPFTAVRDLHHLHTLWVVQACDAAPDTQAARELKQLVTSKSLVFEIAPMVSIEGEGLTETVLSMLFKKAECAAEGAVISISTADVSKSPCNL